MLVDFCKDKPEAIKLMKFRLGRSLFQGDMSAVEEPTPCNYRDTLSDAPALGAQFFYSSPIGLDDPAFVLPTPGKYPPLAFSEDDNNSLEDSWRLCYMSRDPTNNLADTQKSSTKETVQKSHDVGSRLDCALAPVSRQASQSSEREPMLRNMIEHDENESIGIDTTASSGVSTPSSDSSYTTCKESLSSASGRSELERILQVASESNSSWEEAGMDGRPIAQTGGELSTLMPALNIPKPPEHHHVQKGAISTQTNKIVDVAVGKAKLYAIRLPALQMLPIYWSPVRDGPTVIRGSWFYSDTMYPVESAIANELELGYLQTGPWKDEWISSLVQLINEGLGREQALFHRLSLEDGREASPTDVPGDPLVHHHNKKCLGASLATDSQIQTPAQPKGADQIAITKYYSGSVVCYEDSKNAFILTAGMEQYSYQRLGSLSKRIRGSVGTPVVRGFDRKMWNRLYPSPKPASPRQLSISAPSTTATTIPMELAAPLEPTDLILVVHGIGQKRSMQDREYSFTYLVNRVRKMMNYDCQNPTVRKNFRDNFGGAVILPVNWRAGFQFTGEAAVLGLDKNKSNCAPSPRRFALSDITPQSIPAVRSLISDVLLDIPLYMSSHKIQMAEAVVKEANRIYRLWCYNHPGFQERGRVHILGHSLGSALCLDILTQQPTFVKSFDASEKIGLKHFEFDTTNLFLVGSPLGFFLLLGGSKLIPRRGRTKPGVCLTEDETKTMTGLAGTYGCMAVNNIYNIMHYDDPIAYRVNATVDVDYAISVKKAEVPSAAAPGSWMETISYAAQSITSSMPTYYTKTATPPNSPISTPPPEKKKNSSTRDFNEVEKKFYLLNDNGQMDYFLKPPEGPEIQYLNMLWAHGSYWKNADFARLLVTEVGREPGLKKTVDLMEVIM